MAEPIALETWLRQEEGFAWIPEAQHAADPAERQRAARALEALEKSLQRIVTQGGGRGWIRHRGVRYLLLVRQSEESLQVMTLARAISWLEGQAPAPEPAAPASPPSPPVLPVRRSPGYYNR